MPSFSLIFNIRAFLSEEFIQTLELLITFICLYGFIIYLLITAKNKKYFQKQK